MKLLQNFFSLPPIQDEAERQTAQVLRMALLFFSILALLYGVFTTIFDLANWERYTLQTTVLFAGMMLAMFFLRRGYVHAVSLAITSFIWLVFTYSAYTGGGVRSSGYYGYLMVLVAVGVLSGRWIDTLVMTFLCLGSGYFMVYAEQNGFLPEPAVPMTSFALWLDSIFFAVVVSSLLFMTMRIKHLSLQRLNQELAERRLAEQRAARSASQLAMLNEIGRTVSEVTDLRAVLESIRQKLAALIPFDFYSVRLFDAATRMVTYLAVYESGRYWDEAPAPLQTGSEMAKVFETGQSVLRLYAPDELESIKNSLHRVGDRTRPTASVIFVPLNKQGQTIGVLTVQQYDFNAYTEEHLRLVEAVAVQVSIAIENARLFENLQRELAERKQAEELTLQVNFQLQRRLKELHALNAVSQAGASVKEEADLLEAVVETLYHSLYPDVVSIGLWDEQEGVLRTHPRANRGLPKTIDQSQFVFRAGEGVVGLVAASRKPHRVKNADDPHYISLDPALRSELCVPILAGEKLLGVLNIESRQPDAFTDADESLLVTIAAQMAASLERLRAEHELRLLNANLEQRVSERTAQLEAANREMEAFSYSISHDLRAPLRSINGFARMLEDEFASTWPPQARSFLEKIRTAGRQMAQMTDALLDFSRLGRKPLNRQRVESSELVRGVIETLMQETAGRQIEWVISSLPPVFADPLLLQRVYVNLLGNAVKYTGTREQARIEIGSFEQNGEVVYFVRDNGVGFDMRYADKLFGVFQRLHREDEFEGTGIGLAMAHRIITRHGGRIWAEAEVGQGAAFYFTLGREQKE